MTFKRRNGGRNKNGQGYVGFIRCSNCGKYSVQDMAMKRNIVEQPAVTNVEEATALDMDLKKMQYCVSCAIHSKEVSIFRCPRVSFTYLNV
ncbi:hypothetical protein ACJIZ3_020111 [Penstemon smallii]|uniref:40S ribosomal protein S26 n=1 Tax=Penstemon smallii TaxID=265156 RepID=A0ABD3SHY8_9LAMI